MPIRILPEHVANQIAAGEVVQRPASIVKELAENAVDAGASSVTILVKDGGRTLVQVIDDGCGMSPADAVACFGRHATSKITAAEDLFALHTFGFRGEALASIAAVAEVELRTRREDDEVGTLVRIAGGGKPQQESTAAPRGTNITVRNLFFNTPARRKFLASVSVENNHIVSEFQRVALCHPAVAFTLVLDGKTHTALATVSSLHQRITALTSRKLGEQLLPLESDTPLVRISGYVGLPATARKGETNQYFFVNGRYFRSPSLHKAVVTGYNNMLPAGFAPSYFVYFDIDPARLDVNIHPQKIQVKFEDESTVWQTLRSTVSRTLGKMGVVPLLEFDDPSPVEIPVYSGASASADVQFPAASSGSLYNPFDVAVSRGTASPKFAGKRIDPERAPFAEELPASFVAPRPTDNFSATESWRDFESGLSAPEMTPEQTALEPVPAAAARTPKHTLQWGGGRYAACATGDGLVLIDTLRARQRIAYEQLLGKIDNDFSVGQRELFPETLELPTADHFLLMEQGDELVGMGFDIRDMGGSTVVVYGLPVEMHASLTPALAVERLLNELRSEGASLRDNRRERLAAALARISTPATVAPVSAGECDELVARLLACNEPATTADGRPVMSILSAAEMEKRLKKG